MVEWLTRRTSYLRIASRMGSNPVKDKPFVSLSKKLHTDCLVLVSSRNGLESVSIS